MTNPDYLRPVQDGLYTLSSGVWAIEKLDYLSRYIGTFETSMREKWDHRNYIDLFAGPGKNVVKGTNRIFLGSPLIALTTRYPFTGFYFVNNKRSEMDALKQRCTASPHFDAVHIFSEDANKIVDIIVGSIRQFSPNSINLAFLDPFGLNLNWSTVAKLGSLQRCDLIIHYSQQGFTRYISSAHIIENKIKIDTFFGTDEWRNIYATWCQGPRKRGLHRELIDFYKDRLKTLGYQEVKQPSEMLTEPLIRNKKRNSPLYRLIFASKHPLGEKFWREIIGRDVYGQEQMFR
jgi:three-Cys-motif partner protein